jgi:hypothetical protein
MNTQATTQQTFKIQLGDKTKMLAKNTYQNVTDLVGAAKASYPKRLANKEISLKYSDQDGDWLYLSEDSDLQALNEHAATLGGKKVKLIIDVTQNNKKAPTEEQKIEQDVAQISNTLEKATIEDEKVIFEDLKDFKFTDIASEFETLINSKENIKPYEFVKTLKEATAGTKAEVHVNRLLKRAFQGKCGRRGMFKKMMKENHGERCHSKDFSSSPDMFAEFHGPHDGRGRHGKHPMRMMKVFKKFMKGFRSSSCSDDSSEERKENKRMKKQARQQNKQKNQENRKEFAKQRPVIVSQPAQAVTGKAGESVDVKIVIENGSPWPLWLTAVKQISADEGVKCEDITLDERLHEETNQKEIDLKVTLPEKVGEYTATYAFFNKRGKQTPGETSTVTYKVIA